MSVQSKNTTGALVAHDRGKGRSGARGKGGGEGRGGDRGGGPARICTYNFEINGIMVPVFYPEGRGRSYVYKSNGRDFGAGGDKMFRYWSVINAESKRGTLVSTRNACREWNLHEGRCTREACAKYHLPPGDVASNLPRREYQTIGVLNTGLRGDWGVKDILEWSATDLAAAEVVNDMWEDAEIAELERSNAKRARESKPLSDKKIRLKALREESARFDVAERIKKQKVFHHAEEPTYLEYEAEEEVEYEAEEEGFGAEAPGEQHFVVVKTEPLGDEELVVDEDDVENAKATTPAAQDAVVAKATAPAAQDATATTAQDAETLKIMCSLSTKAD
jgi:hypothetical protein